MGLAVGGLDQRQTGGSGIGRVPRADGEVANVDLTSQRVHAFHQLRLPSARIPGSIRTLTLPHLVGPWLGPAIATWTCNVSAILAVPETPDLPRGRGVEERRRKDTSPHRFGLKRRAESGKKTSKRLFKTEKIR